jgi:ribonucleoside-diphosphate reductase alpha chain
LLDNKPYEVFAFNSPTANNNITGKVVKKSKGHYTFLSDSYTIENLQLSDHADEALLTRWVSLLLRHGANPKFVIEQTEKSQLEINTFGKALVRVLKRYITDGEISTVSCENCGSDKVIFQEGCRTCKNCGNSKC